MTIINKWTVGVFIAIATYGGWHSYQKREAEREALFRAEVEARLKAEKDLADANTEFARSHNEKKSQFGHRGDADNKATEEEVQIAGQRQLLAERQNDYEVRFRMGEAELRDLANAQLQAAEIASLDKQNNLTGTGLIMEQNRLATEQIRIEGSRIDKTRKLLNELASEARNHVRAKQLSVTDTNQELLEIQRWLTNEIAPLVIDSQTNKDKSAALVQAIDEQIVNQKQSTEKVLRHLRDLQESRDRRIAR